jgi:hypothetical protein
MVDKFWNDRDFAQQTLVNWAAQNGYQLTPIGQAGQGGPQRQAPQQQDQGKQLAEGLKQNLAPELHWMADALAPALQGLIGNQLNQALEPLVKHQQTANQQQRDQEYDRHAAELAQRVPHWEEHEETMSELYDYLTSPAQNHPKFGSKLQMLYDMATAKSASIAEATKRINGAAKNRTATARGGVPSKVQPNIAKMDKDAAWDFAVKQAKAQHQSR